MKWSSLILLCCLWGVPGVVLSQDTTTGAIRGIISDTSTEQLPVEGARVVIVNARDGTEFETASDSYGEYKRDGIPAGRNLLSVYKDGYGDRTGKPVTVVAGGTHYVPIIMTKTVLSQNATTGTIRGNIVDISPEQLPIEGVRVVIVNARDGTEFETTSDSNGEYKRAGIPPDRYLLSIYKDGYGDRTGKPVTVVAGGDHYVPLKMYKKEPPWLLLICLGAAAVLIVGIAIVVGLRDRPSD